MNVKSRAHYEKQRQLAYERDQGRCVVGVSCSAEQTHHRQGRGGPDPHRLSNLVSVCAHHHARIHSSPAWAYENGFMVRRTGIATTETEPIRYGDLMAVLTNDWEPR